VNGAQWAVVLSREQWVLSSLQRHCTVDRSGHYASADCTARGRFGFSVFVFLLLFVFVQFAEFAGVAFGQAAHLCLSQMYFSGLILAGVGLGNGFNGFEGMTSALSTFCEAIWME